MAALRLSVIVPTYNRSGLLLQESLVSILEQTRKPDEIIVVDDGSTDDTGTQVEHLFAEWKWKWPQARYIRLAKNKGKSVAANVGLYESTGDIIWIWDDDDIAALDRLEKIVPMFKDESVGLVHTGAQWIEPDGQIIGWQGRHTHISQVPRAQLRGNMWFTISVAFRRELVDLLAHDETHAQVKGAQQWCRHFGLYNWTQTTMGHFIHQTWPLDPRLIRAQDYDLWIRLAATMLKHGFTCQHLPDVTVEARNHRGGRGPGHKIAFDDIPTTTLKYEKIIMRKFFSTVPLNVMFPGADSDPHIKAAAHTERVLALMLRGLHKMAHSELEELRPITGSLVTREHQHMLRQVAQQQAETGGPLADMLQSICMGLPASSPDLAPNNMLIF